MKHLLSIATENNGVHSLVTIDPTNATLVYSQTLMIGDLNALIEKDRAALILTLHPNTDGKPQRESRTSSRLIGTNENGSAIYATSVFVAAWDGSAGNDGYGVWRTARYRFRIVEVNSAGIIPRAAYDHTALLKEGHSGWQCFWGAYNGTAYFQCAKPISYNATPALMVKLSTLGGPSLVDWPSPRIGGHAFAVSCERLHIAINKDNMPI